MKSIIRMVLFFLSIFLVSCKQTSSVNSTLNLHPNELVVNDWGHLYKVNADTGKVEKIADFGQEWASAMQYDPNTKSLFGTTYGDDFDNLCIFQIGETGTQTYLTHGYRTLYMYKYKHYVVLQSDEIFTDKNKEVMGEWGVYDLNKKDFVLKQKEYGDFRGITGRGNKAYVSTFDFDKKARSNVVEINLDTMTTRKIFSTLEKRPPRIYFDGKGQSYAFYNHWDDFGPANELDRIDLKTGKRTLVATLPPYSFNMTIIDHYAVVTHYDELNGVMNIPEPISVVDLNTGKVSSIKWSGGRPFGVGRYKNKAAVATEKGTLLLIDPVNLRIDKTIKVTNRDLFFAISQYDG